MKNIVVTGAAGFIGCNVVRRLNKDGFTNLILVDDFNNSVKFKNLEGVSFSQKIPRFDFTEWVNDNSEKVEFIFHLGARTDTTEFDFKILDSLNLNYSKTLWKVCTEKQIPLLYASSAATYGLGDQGFSDDHSLLRELKPLNPYGLSKHLFDLFTTEQMRTPPFWCGLKFFNVYGPYENHKGKMASVVFQAYKQIKNTGKMHLFKSHNPEYKDGEQLRDFIYVDDVVDVCLFLFKKYRTGINSGIYNVGSATERTFNDLAKVIFATINFSESIEYIPIPENIRNKYQYFTRASIDKLKSTGFRKNFISLEKGIENYVVFLKMLKTF